MRETDQQHQQRVYREAVARNTWEGKRVKSLADINFDRRFEGRKLAINITRLANIKESRRPYKPYFLKTTIGL